MFEHHPELVRQAEYLITEGGVNLVLPGGQTLYEIDVAEKAPFWIRMTATGRGGHGSSPIADSAPDRLVKAMNRVIAWETPIRVLPFVEEGFRNIAPLQPEPRATQFLDIRKALNDRAFAKAIMEDEDFSYLLHNTISLTVLKGSEQTNVIPDTASCEFDIRLLPGEDPAEFLAQLRKVVADEQIQLEPINHFRKPNSSPTSTMLYHLFVDAIREHNPRGVITPAMGGGYTECQMYRELGIQCYGFVPVEITTELDDTQHAINERIPVEEIRRGIKMYYEVVARAALQ
jgi:acetylornithine deacetylase/succinyl-diaminopimelate desuccinylase-like protein